MVRFRFSEGDADDLHAGSESHRLAGGCVPVVPAGRGQVNRADRIVIGRLETDQPAKGRCKAYREDVITRLLNVDGVLQPLPAQDASDVHSASHVGTIININRFEPVSRTTLLIS